MVYLFSFQHFCDFFHFILEFFTYQVTQTRCLFRSVGYVYVVFCFNSQSLHAELGARQ